MRRNNSDQPIPVRPAQPTRCTGSGLLPFRGAGVIPFETGSLMNDLARLAVAGLIFFAGYAVASADTAGGTASLMDGRHCNFNVHEEHGKLVPTDRGTGEVLGYFERWPSGSIQLTTPEGYTPTVTGCLMAKGFSTRLHEIPPYWVPSDKKN